MGVNTATRVHAELLKIFLTTDMHRSQLSPLQQAMILHNGRKSPKNWVMKRKIEFVTSVSFFDINRSMFSWQTLLLDKNVIGYFKGIQIYFGINIATTVDTELLKILLSIDLHRPQFSPMQWATISHNGRKSPKNWLTMRKIEFVTSVSFCDFTRSMFSWHTLLPDENVIGPKVNKVSNVVWFFHRLFCAALLKAL